MVLLAAAILAAAGVTVGLLVRNADQPLSGGPLYVGEPDAAAVFSSDEEVGATVVWGSVVLRNTGASILTIRDVTLRAVGDISGLRVEGMYFADMARHTGPLVSIPRQWPPADEPPDNVRPVPGYVMEPREQSPAGYYRLLVHFTVLKEGKWAFSGYTVRYEANGRTYVTGHDDGFRVCVPVSARCQGSS